MLKNLRRQDAVEALIRGWDVAARPEGEIGVDVARKIGAHVGRKFSIE